AAKRADAAHERRRDAASVTAGRALGPFGDDTHDVRVAPDVVLSQKYPFVLPPLGYAFQAAEPAVDAATLRAHHERVHAAHVASLNAALAAHPSLHPLTLGELLMGLRRWPAAVRPVIRLDGSAHANHALYWTLLAPGAPSVAVPGGKLAEMIRRDFADREALQAAIVDAAAAHAGTGWVWLVKTATSRLAIRTLPEEDSPLLEGELPIVGIDLWEHAYAPRPLARRRDYVLAVLARLNWDVAGAQVE
ncbi:MAG: superoxide dismutase, partial [Gemmatimonadaceae bacterium]